MRRREFVQLTAIGAGLALCPRLAWPQKGNESAVTSGDPYRRPARHYVKLTEGIVECQLCPRRCRVSDLERGYCGVRENQKGDYYTLVYSRVCAANIDPIEKKPFFHYLPGTLAFSVATAGCNLNCKFCQNWDISQFRPEDVPSVTLTPTECAAKAVASGCASIAYTYSEPTVFYEYMYDCAVAGKTKGLRSLAVTAGFIEEQPLKELLGVLDGIKVDLKAYTERYYRDVCRGQLAPVLSTLKKIKEAGIWLEIVYLVVPGLNDSDSELIDLCHWVMTNLGPDVPIHFTRFHPTYLLRNLPMTPVSTLEKARQIAVDAGLHYAYIGNVFGHRYESTYCHRCNNLLIKRLGFQVESNHIKEGKCPFCQNLIPGVWS